MNPSPTNAIIQVCERALLQAINNAVAGTVSAGIATLESDESQTKPPMPYILVRCETATQELGPQVGIYKIDASINYRSHVRDTTPEQRETVIVAIQNFLFSNPAATLSTYPNFHVFGVVPEAGSLAVETETKSYVYKNTLLIHAMPRNNS